MLKAIIISGLFFTVGNVIWKHFDEPKLFWVPLSVFISLMLYYIKGNSKKQSVIMRYFITYLFVLSLGNIVKQIFYSDRISQINDYIWGGLATITLLTMIVRWVILKQRYGTS